MLAELRKTVTEIEPEQAKDMMDRSEIDLLLDVREDHEWAAGHIPGATHIPTSTFPSAGDPDGPAFDERLKGARDKKIVVYCALGVRSLMVADALKKLGYENVVSMNGGINRWFAEERPVQT